MKFIEACNTLKVSQMKYSRVLHIRNHFLRLYIKNARECLTMISKHEKAYEARGAKPRELYIAFECFDIMGKHERKFLI